MDVLIQSLVRWCEEQRALYQRQLVLIETKVLWTREYRSGQRVDTTDETAETAQNRIAELNELLVELRKHTRHKDQSLAS
jgi:hypothetical protein